MADQPHPGGELAEVLRHAFAAGARASFADADFDALARRIFEYQYAHNAPYRAWADSMGRSPERISGWEEIPLVPTRAFKTLDLVCGTPDDARVRFRTSGTTIGAGRRGVHHVLDPSLYDGSLRAGVRAWVVPDGVRLRMFSLVRSAAHVPDSSLGTMADLVAREFCAEVSPALVHEGAGLDEAGALELLRAWSGGTTPVLVFATAFALAALTRAVAASGEDVRLPAGSRVLETGGFKGRAQELTRAELRAQVARHLGVGPEWVVSEYGMTEMLSQFYDPVLRGHPERSGVFEGPAWVRTRVLDPVDLTPASPGTPGVLAHYDLANLHSVSALLTEDLGIQETGGFRLLGRARGSELRGCSLAYEELVRAQSDV